MKVVLSGRSIRTSVFLPEVLTSRHTWVLWQLEERNGRATKVPHDPRCIERMASSTNPMTWSDYDTAREAAGDRYGVGIVLTGDITCVDLDHCIGDDGTLSDTAEEVLRHFPHCYTEVSQSRSGLHVFCRGCLPASFKNSLLGVEGYSQRRYIAVTFNALVTEEPTECQDGLLWVYETFGPRKTVDIPKVTQICAASDEWVIRHASEHGKFHSLFNGDMSGYGSRSEADMALCISLAFWCDRDPAAIDRIFRLSGLCRGKWVSRADYRERTIKSACAVISQSYSEWKMKQREERRRKSEERLRGWD